VSRVMFTRRSLFKYSSVNQEYEIQLSNMNRSLQRHEDIVKKLHVDKQQLTVDMSNMRDLNATIETKKEQIIRQLTSKEIENEQLQATLSDMRMEIDMLRTQMNNEKSMVLNLEQMIGSSREKDFHQQLQVQERDADVQLLTDRVNMNETKLYVDETN
jgi:chromosome segregation ATPase